MNGYHHLALVFLALVWMWARREARLYEEQKCNARERLAESARRAQTDESNVTRLWPRAVRDDDTGRAA